MQVFWSNPSFSTFQGRAFRVAGTVGRQPSWVVRAALGAGLLVLLAILALILVPVIAVMVLVFTLAAGIARIRRWLTPLRGDRLVIVEQRPRNEGRENVRVIR